MAPNMMSLRRAGDSYGKILELEVEQLILMRSLGRPTPFLPTATLSTMGGELVCHNLWWSTTVLLQQVHLYMYAHLVHNCGGVGRPLRPTMVGQGYANPLTPQ